MKTMITNTKKQHIIAYALLLLLTVLAVKNAAAQKQGATWYLGNRSGINIGETPYVLNDGVLVSGGSCSSYSEPTGELKIYSNGQTIWNSKHLIVTNGDSIKGSPDASQGTLMIKMPALPHFIFVFTTGVNGGDSLRYTLVDIAAYNHMGQVDPMHKNIAIAGPVEEKLTAVYGPDGSVWVVAHGYKTDEYIAYKLTGIQYPEDITPVISHIGNIDNIGAKGCMKLSPDGSKIARSMSFQNKLEFASFDINTGVVSNVSAINNLSGCYGVEFSSNSKRLYATTQGTNQNYIQQYDVSLPTYSAIITSKYSLIPPVGIYPTALQLGYDGVVYVANSQANTLGVISNADTLSDHLIYGPISQDLGHMVYNGLPAFNQGYFRRGGVPPVTTTALSEDAASTIAIYPNPSTGLFKLNLGEINSDDVKLNVYNMTGTKVFGADKFEEGQKLVSIDLSKQPSGIYLFEVITPKFKTVKRLVINN